jgi:hypothetical protein
MSSGPADRRLDYMTEHGVAVVGWSSTGPLDRFTSEPELRARLAADYADSDVDALDSWAAQLWAFATQIRVGDEIAVRATRVPQVALARVTGAYRFDGAAPENRRHQVPVLWAEPRSIDGIDESLRSKLDSPLSVAAVPSSSGLIANHRVSRRAVLVAGATALGAAGVAAALHPWDQGSGPLRHTDRAGRATPDRSAVPTRVQSTPNGPVAQWVVDENAKPGTRSWNLGNPGPDGAIEGYASVVSTQRGTPVQLFVSTVDPTFHVEAYRLGWYQGTGGRLVWQSPSTPGTKQPDPVITAGINMAEAPWHASLEVPVDDRFPPGVYLFMLVGASGVQHIIPLTVRDDVSSAAYAVQSSVTTWQAYNDWGGYSLYKGPDGSFARRARVVSFDRPYKTGSGQSDFLGLEFPLIMLMEQLGLDVTYTTDVDTHAHPELLLRHKAYFSLGHDEYWSKEMRDGVEGARDAGVNLVFFGANAAFRQIRFDSSPVGPNRREICYKSDTEDPIRSTQPSLTTTNWRESPVARPESSMIGEQYENNPVRADMVIADPSAWVFNGTGVVAGQRLSGTIGSEYDRYLPTQVGPPNVQIFAHSPVVCRGVNSFADMTYYSAPSGAAVLATGTIDWISQLTPAGPGSPNNPVVVAITKNLLAGFGQAKAGNAHPSTPNYPSIAQQFGA